MNPKNMTNQNQPPAQSEKAASPFARTSAPIILALLALLLVGSIVALTRQSSSSGPGTRHVHVVSAPSYRDPDAGGFRAANGQLLWRETHTNSACVRLSPTQSAALDTLEPYVMVDAKGQAMGGQLVARLIAVELGAAPEC